MRLVSGILISFCALCFFLLPVKNVLAQEASPSKNLANEPQAYIIDDLYIFMRSGAGSQYRLLGSINAGTQVTLLEAVQNGYQKIIDDKGRSGWVEVKYLQKSPGLRYVIAELNAQLADKEDQIQKLKTLVDTKDLQLSKLTASTEQLTKQLKLITKQLNSAQNALEKQDTSIQKQWFYNGAIVLGIGLILGLILPRLGGRRRSSMASWK